MQVQNNSENELNRKTKMNSGKIKFNYGFVLQIVFLTVCQGRATIFICEPY